jgi:hypothetical protein
MSTQPTIVEIKEEVTTIQASTEDIVVNLTSQYLLTTWMQKTFS